MDFQQFLRTSHLKIHVSPKRQHYKKHAMLKYEEVMQNNVLLDDKA